MPNKEELGLTSRTKKLLEMQKERPKYSAFGDIEPIDKSIEKPEKLING